MGNNREVCQAPPSEPVPIYREGGGAGFTSQRTQYYPSGLPWAEGEGASVQNKKYNGKEWIEAHGLDEYDYGARGYYPAIGRFTTVDPLAEKNPWISPYQYCSNNPINRVDPDGRDDVYSRQGKFIEHNKNEIEKKQDHIVIREQNYLKKALVSVGLGDTKVVKNMLDNIDTRIENTTLSAESYANVFTNILSETTGVNMNNLYDESISVVVSHNDYNVDDQFNSPCLDAGQNASEGSIGGQTRITASIINSGDEYDNRYLFSTTSNVQNLLGAHEKIGHGQNGWGAATNTHQKVYEYQFKHTSWKNTTQPFKDYMKDVYKNYIYPIKK